MHFEEETWKKSLVSHLAESDWLQYLCTTECITLFVQNVWLPKQAEVINFILLQPAGN